jgi:quercetin dioxygenase-like cupin family protein
MTQEVEMEERALWFLNTLVRVRVAEADGKDGLSVLEHQAPSGDSPPLHIHNTEDEIFHILEGEFRIQVGDDVRVYGPGSLLVAPKGIPHTYYVESSSGARWVTVTAHGDFERFVRTLARVAERDELPPPADPPSPEEAEHLATTAKGFGIELVGPPLH